MIRYLKYLAVVLVALVVLVGAGFAFGVLGVPSVTSVDNGFGGVNESTTVIETEIGVSNPNPIGISLGGVQVDYSVDMNGVPIANGTKSGLSIPQGDGTLNFTTAMDNERIPEWWYTHVENGEQTQVNIDATATSSTFGQSVSFNRTRSVETDILSGFASDETRPINASQPLVRDPVLYLNSTDAGWDRANLTRERTPMDMQLTVYNPKAYPFAVSRIGYNVTMNDIQVGSGETAREYIVGPNSERTLAANAAIRNERLDEWWVSHLQNDQVTSLRVDFYLIVEVQGEQFRINPDSMDYTTTIETDIFGNKDASGGGGDADGTESGTESAGDVISTDEGAVGDTPVTGTVDDGVTTDSDIGDVTTVTDDGVTDGVVTSNETDDGILQVGP